MSTEQKYDAPREPQSANEPADGLSPATAQSAAQPLNPADHRRFVSYLADLRGLPLEELMPTLNQRLLAAPLRCENVLTATSLLRAVQSLTGTDLAAHYGLLLRESQIVGVALIPAGPSTEDERQPLLGDDEGETRPLLAAILNQDATALLLATTRDDGEYLFEPMECVRIQKLAHALELLGVELLEYLLFYSDLNLSWRWTEEGDAGLEDAVSITRLENCGLPTDGSTGYSDDQTTRPVNRSTGQSGPANGLGGFVGLNLSTYPQPRAGHFSQVDLVYWSLSDYKGRLVRQLFNGLRAGEEIDEDDEQHMAQIELLDQLQNDLFTRISGLDQLPIQPIA